MHHACILWLRTGGEKLSKGERKLRAEDMKEILKEERELSDRFFELVIGAEKKALKERFW